MLSLSPYEDIKSLRALSSHLLMVQEVEQRRIAMELHDQIGQDLNVIKLRLKKLLDRLRKDQPALKQDCSAMLAIADKIIDEIRLITKDLSPPALENLGLAVAVRQMVREFNKHTGIPIESDIALLERIIAPDIRIGLYRIIQETLMNIHKHAQAARVTIKAVEDPTGIELKIQDNGKGFYFPATAEGPGNGMGLEAMNLRSSMIGAQLTIQSRIGAGTCITVRLPVQKETVVP